MTKDEIQNIIDSTIIDRLYKNNIFENIMLDDKSFASIMSINQVRNKLLSIVKNIEYKDLSKKECYGYWEPFNNNLVIHESLTNDKLQYDQTVIHELLHALTTTETDYSWSKRQYEKYSGMQCWYLQDGNKTWQEYGRGLNEGTTEWLAERLLSSEEYKYEYLDVSFMHSGSYPFEQVTIKQLALLYGEDKIIDAYLNNHDIEIPEKDFKLFRRVCDHINEQESHISNIRQGRKLDELSNDEQKKINDAQKNIADTFKASQEFFLEKCLTEKINEMSTKEQAFELGEKLRLLNSIEIKVKDNPKANYEEYNFRFIRKYLQIINKDLDQDNKVTFEQMENFLSGNDLSIAQSQASFIGKIKSSFLKLKDAVKSYLPKKEAEFIQVGRGQEEKIYLKQCGKEVIGGNNVYNYQYLTEEEYLQYQAGDINVKGEILKGNIDFKKFKKDKEYAKVVSEQLLNQDRIDDKIINYNGYIGYIDNELNKQENPDVQLRLEENEKYIKVKPDGYEQEMYILELPGRDEKEYSKVFNQAPEKDSKNKLKQYKLFTKEDVKFCKQFGTAWRGVTIQGNIDLGRISYDNKYKEFLEKQLITKERVEEKCRDFQGYVGEIKDCGYEFEKVNYNNYLEQFANRGANGEEKRVGVKYITNNKGEREIKEFSWYIQKGEKTGEKDLFGNEIYNYEIINSEEMMKMWQDKSYINSPNREKLVIKSSEQDVQYMSHRKAIVGSIYYDGYVGSDRALKNSQKAFVLPEYGVVLWEKNGKVYCSLDDPDGPEETYSSKKQIFGNIDIERMNNDPEYKKFMEENVLTYDNLKDITLYNKINKIEIKEVDGNLSVGEIGKYEPNIATQKNNRTQMVAIQK